jgi:uracil phosphoribosyltransferase
MFNFQIRLVIEESLNQLPFSKCVVTTPTGAQYQGLKYQKGNCGVSIVRSGEAMEQVCLTDISFYISLNRINNKLLQAVPVITHSLLLCSAYLKSVILNIMTN